jgi:hypothetical protein
MTKLHNAIERLAIGHAVQDITVLDDDYLNRPFEVYLQIKNHVSSNGPEPTSAYIDDSTTWPEALSAIEHQAQGLTRLLKGTLKAAQQGLCIAAINCELDSDMNAVDMLQMVEDGLKVDAQ